MLAAVVDDAGDSLEADNPRVLKLRSRRAPILVLGGDYRRALPEFDHLVDAYRRTAGPTSPQALECLHQAAHCRAELGRTNRRPAAVGSVCRHSMGWRAMSPMPRPVVSQPARVAISGSPRNRAARCATGTGDSVPRSRTNPAVRPR